jgi:hypothetical protein
MIAPDRVVMGDSPAIRDHGVERRALDCEPLRAELARLAERDTMMATEPSAAPVL